MHTNLLERKFVGATEDLNIGLLESELRKTRTRTLSPVRAAVAIRNTPPYHPKHVFERFIISKLEEYDSTDKSRLVEVENAEEHGSTMNFFKLHHRPIPRQQNLSSSFNRVAQQTLNLFD